MARRRRRNPEPNPSGTTWLVLGAVALGGALFVNRYVICFFPPLCAGGGFSATKALYQGLTDTQRLTAYRAATPELKAQMRTWSTDYFRDNILAKEPLSGFGLGSLG